MASAKQSIQDVAELETLLSEPTDATIRTLAALEGDILILGVGGKMGPTLARMAKRAADSSTRNRRIIGVSRFSSSPELCALERQLQSFGIETVRCDLLNREALAKLPDAANIVYMAGMKFGSTGQESLTWAMNSYLPGMVCERYPQSRIAAFSTGNVYGLTPVKGSGSQETDFPNPVGEYAISCLGRERIFEHFSRANRTPISIIRLNYSTEMRYGVLVDIATRVHTGQPVSLGMGYLNAIWQRDANAQSLQSLAHASSPPFFINIAGPELLSVRKVAEQFSQLLGKPVEFSGLEAEDALLSDSSKAQSLFGMPTVSADQMLEWIADWVARGGESLAKPTHFEERSGKF